MACLASFRARAADLALGFEEVQRIEPLATARTFVAARWTEAAVVAGAQHVAVGQEHVVRGAKELLGLARQQVAALSEASKEFLAQRGVRRRDARARPDVEREAEGIES